MRIGSLRSLMLCLLVMSGPLSADEQASVEGYVVQDGEVGLTYKEMKVLTGGWTSQMLTAAREDDGDRLELINLALANKKLALAAEDFVVKNPELSDEYYAGLHAYQRRFLLGKQREMIVLPDFSKLAEEEYLLKREKIAVNPERRLSSHILFSSPPGLPRTDLLLKAQGVLDELRNGASFEEMVNQYSDEPNAAAKKGLYNYWMQYGDQNVSPPYSKGVFEISNVGEYGELAQTQFGVHIIRLDGIQEKTYKPFEEVKPQLIEKMVSEYQALAMKDYLSQFNISDDAIIDDEAMNEILAPAQ